MNVYPAIKASMGTWTYYIVKMRMREVATEVKFGAEVHDDYTLDEAIQRALKEPRVKKEIIPYLTRRIDHFFPSVVVAVIGGAPKFLSVHISPDDPLYEVFGDEESLDQSFGLLRFSGTQNYYALDGQHRLKAIKMILQPHDSGEIVDPPPGFADEEISVLMVMRPAGVSDDDWLSSYRRLFTSLNRYAKPTDADTNIVMDEDDIIAIITRRLISKHDFFKSSGRHLESLRIQTKGRPLKEGTSYFTSLQELYDLNHKLLDTHRRSNEGWGPPSEPDALCDFKQFIMFRPSEAYIDSLYDELSLYWDALISAIPVLSLNPADAKDHQSDGSDGQVADNALFWPIGQSVMINAARALLDMRLEHPESPTVDEVIDAVRPLGEVDWKLHSLPWRGLLLVSTLDKRSVRRWTMRSEGRKEAIATAVQILRWFVGLYQPNADEEERLQNTWLDQLVLPPDENHESYWEEVREIRNSIIG